MTPRHSTALGLAAFACGLAAVGWIAAGYIGSSPLALLMTGLIAVAYGAGGLELWRYHQATRGLQHALHTLQHQTANTPDASTTPVALSRWLQQLPPGLRHPARLRIEGERVGLPGPALAPYLVGLLVLLGMLGTFLGMVVTLRGAAAALQTSTDLPTIRAALTTPVQGLGLAFGTSVAGVAASAMLGLVSALCRRARLQASALLDSLAGGPLRAFSQAHQREQTLLALQALQELQGQQAQAMPALVDRLQAVMDQIAQQGQALGAQLLANQDSFHRSAQATHSGLAAAIDQSLQRSLAETARLTSASITPVVEATMAGITRETSALHAHIASAAQLQLDGVAERLGSAVDSVAATWQTALAQQQQASSALGAELQASQAQWTHTLGQQSTAVLAALDQAQQRLLADLATRDAQRLAALAQPLQALAHDLGSAWQQAGAQATQHQQAMAQTLDQAARGLQAQASQVADGWQAALAQHLHTSQAISSSLQASQTGWTERLGQQSSALLAAVDQAQQRLLADLAERDAQRLGALVQPLQAMASQLRDDWQQAGVQTLLQQQAMAHTLETTVQAMHAQAGAHTRATTAEVSRLLQAAGEAPRAAAEAMAALRQQLSDSLARDQALQEERRHTATTLHGLLDAVQHTTNAQRAAIDTLVSQSATQLQQAAERFGAQAEASASRVAEAATHVAAGAVDVASLGEAFGAAVGQFGDGNQALVGQLARIEAALAKTLQRSDEQLAYYVAQAREIMDLSLLSQKQIVDDLQQLASRSVATAPPSTTPAPTGATA